MRAKDFIISSDLDAPHYYLNRLLWLKSAFLWAISAPSNCFNSSPNEFTRNMNPENLLIFLWHRRSPLVVWSASVTNLLWWCGGKSYVYTELQRELVSNIGMSVGFHNTWFLDWGDENVVQKQIRPKLRHKIRKSEAIILNRVGFLSLSQLRFFSCYQNKYFDDKPTVFWFGGFVVRVHLLFGDPPSTGILMQIIYGTAAKKDVHSATQTVKFWIEIAAKKLCLPIVYKTGPDPQLHLHFWR